MSVELLRCVVKYPATSPGVGRLELQWGRRQLMP